MKELEATVIFILVYGAVAVVGWLFIFHAGNQVSSQARLLRLIHKTILRRSDEELDKYQLPTDRYLMGGYRSAFINQAPEHPERFPRSVTCYQLIGCFIWGALFLALCLMLYATLTGKPMTINLP